jgi:hypothetical protein
MANAGKADPTGGILDILNTMGVQDLLRAKRAVSLINQLVFNRLRKRLDQLVSEMLKQEVVVQWEDIALVSTDDEVYITGLRTFDIGETIEYEGVEVEIDDANVDVMAMRIRIVVRPRIIDMLLDGNIEMGEIVAEMNAARYLPGDEDLTPLPPDPPDQMTVDTHLYLSYSKSSTKH